MCGAPSSSGATQCAHCNARLASVACPSCFGMIFIGSKFCPHCGEKVGRAGAAAGPRECPNCRTGLRAISLGAAVVHECGDCEGLWVDVETFNAICADREKQADVVERPAAADRPPDPMRIEDARYRPCAACGTLMNRVNFSGSSGVILDICKSHGVWCDRDELRRIVEFIRAGGVGRSRQAAIERWKEAQRLGERSRTQAGASAGAGALGDSIDWMSPAVDLLGEIVSSLFD